MTPPKKSQDERGDSVAAVADNDKLEHTRGGSTTRDDRLDAGVPMKAGEAGTTEPVGPEDAFGIEPTRGDYSGRTAAGPSMRSVPLSAEEREAAEKDGGEVPRSKLVEQSAAPTV